ncbi:hypothetical protein O6H91_08G058500 [Diphasiastrum complanatum]|uniref:Uncharacterized protein n=1 Tax=Diphasiastrum complanatum TaxID=34168 RepID=A0ACC2CYY6_DIPCM|nr:hypothetical protein O6H91_08G058500 [Diphasiastrum complanatum]
MTCEHFRGSVRYPFSTFPVFYASFVVVLSLLCLARNKFLLCVCLADHCSSHAHSQLCYHEEAHVALISQLPASRSHKVSTHMVRLLLPSSQAFDGCARQLAASPGFNELRGRPLTSRRLCLEMSHGHGHQSLLRMRPVLCVLRLVD